MDCTGQYLYDSNMSRGPEDTILNYNLFGEVGDLPDVVHCETIEARSLLHDWEFAPHRHARLHQVLLVESGGGRASLDGRMHPLGPMTLVNVPTGEVHGFSFATSTKGYVVTLAAEMLDVALHAAEGLRAVLARPATLPADEACSRTMIEIDAAFAARDFARAQILRSLSGLLLGQTARLMSAHGRVDPISERPDILRRFEALLEEHFREQWSVADYARRLAVSPTHLSRITRTATGRSASRLIEERVVREARRNLVYTNLPVSTIAYTLGYSDPAYFSRVFARATGHAPRDFRARSVETAED